ncbi:MAG: hypothetical protein FJ291_11845 [Planctomycetes bacterium]|nr:hypothetical protein [Planctomycetota bacterium]
MGKLASEPVAEAGCALHARHAAATPAESVAPEAARFMSARGLSEAHERVKALVREEFPSLKSLATSVECDPDAPHVAAVRLRATVGGPVEKAMACKDAFDEALARDDGGRLSAFVVTVKVV